MWRLVPLTFLVLICIVGVQGGCHPPDYASLAEDACGPGKVRSITIPDRTKAIVVCKDGAIHEVE